MTKTHTLNITNGGRYLAASLLNIPQQFKTVSEILRAGRLHEKLSIDFPTTKEEATEEWASKSSATEVTEVERDLLKACAEQNTRHIPIGPHAQKLLIELGFTD